MTSYFCYQLRTPPSSSSRHSSCLSYRQLVAVVAVPGQHSQAHLDIQDVLVVERLVAVVAGPGHHRQAHLDIQAVRAME